MYSTYYNHKTIRTYRTSYNNNTIQMYSTSYNHKTIQIYSTYYNHKTILMYSTSYNHKTTIQMFMSYTYNNMQMYTCYNHKSIQKSMRKLCTYSANLIMTNQCRYVVNLQKNVILSNPYVIEALVHTIVCKPNM